MLVLEGLAGKTQSKRVFCKYSVTWQNLVNKKPAEGSSWKSSTSALIELLVKPLVHAFVLKDVHAGLKPICTEGSCFVESAKDL